jgi:hypothetical protein
VTTNKSKALILGALASAGLHTEEANAGLVTVSEGISDYLSGGTMKSGAFDLNAFLQTQNDAGNAVDITAATLRVYGYSSKRNTATSYQYITSNQYYSPSYYRPSVYRPGYSYGCGWSTCSYASYYSPSYYSPSYYSSTSTYKELSGDGQVDTLLVDFGNQNLSDNTLNSDLFLGNRYSPTYYQLPNGDRGYNNTTYQRYERNDYGNVYASMALSPLSLNDLRVDGLLGYRARATQGHFNSVNLFLDVQFALNPITQVITNPSGTQVSGPSTLLLSTLGSIGLLGLARRRGISKEPK